jgi:peptide deformylase
MNKLSIVTYPDPILRHKTARLDPKEAGLKRLVEEMFEVMYAAEGVGLAANQVGLDKRLAVIDCSGGADPAARLVLINPEMVSIEGELEEEEGCLSFPKIRAKTRRGIVAKVRAQGLDGKFFEVEGEGLLGKALQHELDHLDGKVFIDRISLVQKALISGKLKELRAEYKDGKAQHAPPARPKPKAASARAKKSR